MKCGTTAYKNSNDISHEYNKLGGPREVRTSKGRRMKYALAAFLAFAAMFGVAQASPVSQPAALATAESAGASVQKVQWWGHGRWRSHARWGSEGGWHNRWRSHSRWGSGGPGWHNRWRSHYRWGSRW